MGGAQGLCSPSCRESVLSHPGTEPERLRWGGGLRLPLGQRLAHMAPKRRRRIRDPCGELLVGTGDVLPKVEAGDIRAPASLRALVGHVLHACGAFVTGTREHFVHALTRDAERTGKQPCSTGALVLYSRGCQVSYAAPCANGPE
jgi:hypothetical protein